MKKSILFYVLLFLGSFLILQSVTAKALHAAPSPTPGCSCMAFSRSCSVTSNNCSQGTNPNCGSLCSCTCINRSDCGGQNQPCCKPGDTCDNKNMDCLYGYCNYPSPAPSTKPNPTADFTGVAKIEDFSTVFNNIVSVILGLAGIIFFVLLIIGGFRYITSGGDPKAIEGAKKTLTSAIIGLIVILMSYLILVLITQITGVNIESFNIKLL